MSSDLATQVAKKPTRTTSTHTYTQLHLCQQPSKKYRPGKYVLTFLISILLLVCMPWPATGSQSWRLSSREADTATPPLPSGLHEQHEGQAHDVNHDHMQPLEARARGRSLTTSSQVVVAVAGAGVSGTISGLDGTTRPFYFEPIGDLDHDGQEDYAVSIRDPIGQVGIVLGAPVPHLTLGAFTTVYTDPGTDYIGHSLTAVGDLNDDGAVDVVAGSHANKIVVLLLRQGGSLLSSTVLDSSSPSMPAMRLDARCGIGMGLLGRLDGDQYNDILMGCDHDAQPTCGVHTLFLGRGGAVVGHASNWCDEAPLAGIVGTNSSTGKALTGVGDIDGDGVLDAAYAAEWDTISASGGGTVLIGFLQHNGSLRSVVPLSKSSGGAVINNHLAAFTTGWRFGASIAGVGDLDRDGVPDVIVGSSEAGSPSNSGRVDILLLQANGTVKRASEINAAVDMFIPGVTFGAGARLGWSVFSAPASSSGFAVVGAFAEGAPDAGGMLLHMSLNISAFPNATSWVGQRADPPPLVAASRPLCANVTAAFSGQNTQVQRGTLLGDVNRDGWLDIALADFQDGEVYILMGDASGQFGAAAARIPADDANYATAFSPGAYTFGHGLTPAGDADGDGVPDLYVGHLESDGPSESGALWLLLLQSSGALKHGFQVTAGMPGKIVGAKCGYGVGSLGDNNRDGLQEILQGCGFFAGGNSFAYLLYMGLNGTVVDWKLHNATTSTDISAGDVFGYAFAALGDLDENGHLDYASLAQESSKLSVQLLEMDGTVLQYVVTPASSIVFDGIVATESGERLASSLSPAGDLNGDGVFDLVVGAPEQQPHGAVFILFMASDGTVKGGRSMENVGEGLLQTYPGASGVTSFGSSVHWLGSYFGDGNFSVIVTSESLTEAEPPVILSLQLPQADLTQQTVPAVLNVTGIPAGVSAHPTATPSGMPTASGTATASASVSPTASGTDTASSSVSPTASGTATAIVSTSNSPSQTPLPTPSSVMTTSPSPTTGTLPPPIVQQGFMASDGLSLVLVFSEGMVTNANVACANALPPPAVASLGVAPRCVWSNATVFRIQMGRGATVLPGAALSMLPSVFEAARLPQRSVTATSVRIAPPQSPVRPRVLVELPGSVPVCSTAVLDARGSQGSGGRPFVVVWMLLRAHRPDGAVLNASALAPIRAALQAASASSALRVELPSVTLAMGLTYTFALSLKSFLGVEASAGVGDDSIQLTATAPGAPSVRALGGSTVAVRRGDAVQLYAAGSASTCTGLPPGTLAFAWQQESGPSAVPLRRAADPRRSTVPARQLLFGRGAYVFCVTVSSSITGLVLSSSACVTVTVLETPLVPLVGGGDRTLGLDAPVLLDASATQDANIAPAAQRPGTSHSMQYAWTCKPVAGSPASNCSALQPALSSRPTAQLQPEQLLPFAGSTLQWTLSVTSQLSNSSTGLLLQARSASSSVRLNLLSTPVPRPQMLRPSGAVDVVLDDGRAAWKVQGAGSVVLASAIAVPAGESGAPVVISWQQLEGDLGTGGRARGLQASAAQQAFSTPLDQATIVIRPNQLIPGRVYSLQISVALSSSPGAVGTGTAVLLTNTPPTAGELVIQQLDSGPLRGLVSQVELSTIGWQDSSEDLPLVYSFWADASGAVPTQQQLQSQAFGLPLDASDVSARLITTLPSPRVLNASGYGNVTVIAYAADNQGALAYRVTNVTVRRPVEPQLDAVHQFIDSRLDSTREALMLGDGAGVLSQLTGMADLLSAVAANGSINSSGSPVLSVDAFTRNLTSSMLQQALQAVHMMDFEDNSVTLATGGAVALSQQAGAVDAAGRRAVLDMMSLVLEPQTASAESPAGSTVDDDASAAPPPQRLALPPPCRAIHRSAGCEPARRPGN